MSRGGAYAGCSACGAQWCGTTTCHCSGCHQTFTAVSSFDRHRRDDSCQEPASVGLVKAGRDYPCWGMDGTGQTSWWHEKTPTSVK